MNIAQYHADTTHASKSALDILNRCPAEYYFRKIDLTSTAVPAHVREEWNDPEKGRHFTIGNAVDCLVLEPHTFQQRFFVTTDKDRRYKEGRDDHAKLCRENAGKDWVSPKEFRDIKAMAKAVTDSWLSVFVDQTRSQTTFKWEDPDTGILCKCRPDWLRAIDEDFLADLPWDWAQFLGKHDEIVFDLKTLDGRWEQHVVDYRYYVQQAFYLDGIEAATMDGKRRMFAFMVVETTWPYRVSVRTLPEEAVRIGRAEYQQNLETLSECRASGEWPIGGGEWSETQLPVWWMAKNRNSILS